MSRKASSGMVRVATIAFFVGYLLVGLVAFKDYGISWDEVPTREFGVMNVEHRVPDLRTLDSVRVTKGANYERFGPFYEIVLVRAEKALGLANPRAVFLMRHLLTFLTFYLAVVLFHAFCKRRFAAGIALLAAVCLVASPQLFAHSFYNTKDVSFLTLFVAAILALDVVLERDTWRAWLTHGVVTGLLLGTRVLGLFAMLMTGVAAIVRRPTKGTLARILVYGLLVAAILPFVWPVLRIDAFGIVKGAVMGSTTNPYGKTNLFRGQMIYATALPWDYVPTWMAITTPYAITLLFLIGSAVTFAALARDTKAFVSGARQRDLIVLSWFFLPVVGCMVLRPVLYDGWRHLFFVYPALIYLSAAGMETVLAGAVARAGESSRHRVPGLLAAALVLSLMPAISFMYRNHPFENLYFNRLAGRDMATVKERFELDYWGLTYRQLLEEVARADKSPVIRLHVANYPGMVNSMMLPPADRQRFLFVRPDEPADYFLTNYRFHPEPYPYPDEAFTVKVGNASAGSAFRLH